jgi:hypothetical protein
VHLNEHGKFSIMKKKKGIRNVASKKKVKAKRKSSVIQSASEKKKPTTKATHSKKAEPYPGYPHYPSTDDIMNPGKGYQKLELNETSRRLVKPKRNLLSGEAEPEEMEKPLLPEQGEPEEEITMSDVTAEEKRLLESDELSEDLGEDEELRTRVWNVDVSGEDLDVPGSELDDEEEVIGEEDEENNLYSLGGDRYEDMEQSHDPGR